MPIHDTPTERVIPILVKVGTVRWEDGVCAPVFHHRQPVHRIVVIAGEVARPFIDPHVIARLIERLEARAATVISNESTRTGLIEMRPRYGGLLPATRTRAAYHCGSSRGTLCSEIPHGIAAEGLGCYLPA